MFPLIQQYLCRYMVLPLSDHTLPKEVNATQVIANLRADALFYQLEGLVQQCDSYLEPVKRGLPASNRYLLVGWEESKDESIDYPTLNIRDIDKLIPTPRQLGWHLYITGQELEKMSFKNLTSRDKFFKGGEEGIRALTGVTAVVDRILPKDGRPRWVVGVNMNRKSNKDEEKDSDNDEGEYQESDEEHDESSDEASDEEDWVDDEEEYEQFEGKVVVVMLEE
ncbi:hypothetical protein B0J17DRAFT_771740 [Rhizoctonia solani]|nr:hypothetical protein B0J17DRAFT_771740 [Rhizoctonia solani]